MSSIKTDDYDQIDENCQFSCVLLGGGLHNLQAQKKLEFGSWENFIQILTQSDVSNEFESCLDQCHLQFSKFRKLQMDFAVTTMAGFQEATSKEKLSTRG
jgi:hypothetical protein